MSDLRYFGCYARIDTVSKDKGAELQGADNIIGDAYTLSFGTVDGSPRAYLVNKFDAEVAFFDPPLSRQLSIMQARGWTLRATLALVAYTDIPDPGHYWGQAVLICNAPEFDDACNTFATSVMEALKDGNRPEVDLGVQAIDAMLGAGGAWKPSKKNDAPKPQKGTVILKSKMQASEKIVEQGRQKNIGCYIVSWAFNIGVVALLIFGALKLFGVL